jgi:hypothetical protein
VVLCGGVLVVVVKRGGLYEREWRREMLGVRIGKDMFGFGVKLCLRVKVPRIMVGKTQSIETLIKEVLLFAKYLRKERKEWKPRLVNLG